MLVDTLGLAIFNPAIFLVVKLGLLHTVHNFVIMIFIFSYQTEQKYTSKRNYHVFMTIKSMTVCSSEEHMYGPPINDWLVTLVCCVH